MDPNAAQCPLFSQEVVGSFPGQCPVPPLEVHLIKHEARLGSELGVGRAGRYSGLGLSPGGTVSSGPPRMPSWLRWLKGRMGPGLHALLYLKPVNN